MRVRLSRALALLVAVLLGDPSLAERLPEEELQVAVNTYTDSFDVTVIYPSVSLTRHLRHDTAVSGRYLVDAVTSASMKSRIPVDGITSATRRAHGGSSGGLDELRHEVAVGAAHVVGELTLTGDVLFSTEQDYRSLTFTSSGVYSLADRNTDVQLSLVRRWDEVFPVTRSWRRDKNVSTVNAGVTQTLGPRAIGQLELSYSTLSGFLSDAYQVVTIIDDVSLEAHRFEPRHPDTRIRRAVGLRLNVSTTSESSVRVGCRYYWDSWEVRSTTLSALLQRHLSGRDVTLGVGIRTYEQTRASFFEPEYEAPRRYMTVDSSLDSSHSLEYQLRASLRGAAIGWLPGTSREGAEVAGRITYYHRRTVTPNWHSRRSALDALVTSLGVRYRF